jgi:D-sedoheptulose 7-phosphate isomerase
MADIDQEFVNAQVREAVAVKQALFADAALMARIHQACELLVETYRRGNKTLLGGNGGSAADAQHIAAEFVSRFYFDRPGLPSIALTTDTSVMTAVGNDYGYEKLFRRQLEANAREGDVFIALSTSGNSGNVLQALEACRSLGVTTLGLTGQPGGRMVALCDLCIQAPSSSTPRIQECHGLIGHVLCAAVEEALFGHER